MVYYWLSSSIYCSSINILCADLHKKKKKKKKIETLKQFPCTIRYKKLKFYWYFIDTNLSFKIYLYNKLQKHLFVFESICIIILKSNV